jgi:hypothetical protein
MTTCPHCRQRTIPAARKLFLQSPANCPACRGRFRVPLAGWVVLPGHAATWTLLGVLAPAGHIFADLVTGFAHGRRRSAFASTIQRATDHAGRWLLLLV